MTTRDEMPEPVTEPGDLGGDAVDRILAEVALPDDALERMGLLPLDPSDLTDIGASVIGLPVLEEVASDLVDLDRLLAETSAPLDAETVAALVAETLGRDPLP